MMNIVLLQMTPPMGGANKCNRALLRGLASRGHRCQLIIPALPEDQPPDREKFFRDLDARGVERGEHSEDAVVYFEEGLEVHAVFNDVASAIPFTKQRVLELKPDWILVSEENFGMRFLSLALEICPGRVVFLAHTTLMLPFGPDCFLRNEKRTAPFKQATGIITCSGYLRDYCRQEGLKASAIPYPVYGAEPFQQFDNFDNGYVTLVNPCSFKGISIFLELAGRFPDVAFAAVPTWGTSESELTELQRCSNIRLLDPVSDIDEIFKLTRVLLVPSLWAEAFGQITVEAMLRGLPVMASDSGGLLEAKLGVDYTIPVNKIERYEHRLDPRGLPVPCIPPQDITPWHEKLARLLTDRDHYREIADASRRAATSFVRSVNTSSFAKVENYLEELAGNQSRQSPSRQSPSPSEPAESTPADPHLAFLAPSKRARLRNLLK